VVAVVVRGLAAIVGLSVATGKGTERETGERERKKERERV
jgi:hypothetical protein